MRKEIKKILVIPFAAVISLSVYSAAFAEGPVPESPGVVSNLPNQDDGHVIRPMALLIDQETDFDGEGYAYFTYSGTGDLRFYIKNTGKKTVYYKVQYPSGYYLLGSSSSGNALDPGEHFQSTFDVYDVHGPGSWGKYTVYVYNDDGSEGSFHVSARTLE